MKLIITTKANCSDTIFEFASEIIEKFSGLNSCAKIENLPDFDLSDLKQEGNAFVYATALNLDGDVDIEELKRYKRVILVALGAKYQNLLKSIFDNIRDENIKACDLFDLPDCLIIADKLSTKLLDKEGWEE